MQWSVTFAPWFLTIWQLEVNSYYVDIVKWFQSMIIEPFSFIFTANIFQNMIDITNFPFSIDFNQKKF